jgi:anionic cell wall polymer biosynthesis LytR-Cps2A-Psr (LCP) family protein
MKKACPNLKEGTRNDYVRSQNQQKVIQAIVNKARTINSPTQLLNILNTVSKSMDTSFTTEQILSFYEIAKDLIKYSASESQNVITLQRLYLTGSGQMIYDESSKLTLWNHIANQSSVSAIKKTMKANLGDSSSLIKKFDFNINEPYSITVVGKNPTSGTILYKLVGNFVGKTKEQAQSLCNSKGITCTFVEQASTKKAGTVIAQSLPESKRVDRVSGGMKLTIAKSNDSQETP